MCFIKKRERQRTQRKRERETEREKERERERVREGQREKENQGLMLRAVRAQCASCRTSPTYYKQKVQCRNVPKCRKKLF